MQLLSLVDTGTISPGLAGLATMSTYFFIAGLVTIIGMMGVYFWYTLGSARLAKRLAIESTHSQGQSRGKSNKASKTASVAGGIGTLVRSDVVTHEQMDGEKPIALNRNLIVTGRIGTTLGWLTVFVLFMSQLLRAIVEQHAPWSNLYE